MLGRFRRFARSIGWSRIAGLAVLAALVFLRFADPVPVQTLRHIAFDTFQRIKPRPYTPQPVVIVDIDEASLRAYGQWPWSRTRLAQLVENLTRYGTAATAFDIVFAEEDRLSPDLFAKDNPSLSTRVKTELSALPSSDETFAAAIAAGRVVLGETSVRSRRDANEDGRKPVAVPNAMLGPDKLDFLRNFETVVQNIPVIEKAASGYGLFTVLPDADGVFRRVGLAMKAEGQMRLFLAMELLRVATGGSAFAIKTNEAGIEGIVLGRQLVRTGAHGDVWPWFSKSRPERFVSAKDVLEFAAPVDALRGKLVLVGTSAIGLEDYRAIPLGELMAGVEIQAQVLEGVLSDQLLVRPNYADIAEIALLIVAGLIVIAVLPMLSAKMAILVSGSVLFALVAGSWLAFDQYRILLDPSIMLAMLMVLMASFSYIAEERQRQQIRGAFSQYVSPKLVDQLADEPDGLQLGGVKRDLTVLFSDIRNFTGISESYKEHPEDLTILMNRLLTDLSDGILEYDGTIDKFMGDAVMAFWNAPLDHDDHAYSACKAALKMVVDVAAFDATIQQEFRERAEAGEEEAVGCPTIGIGIGINTGECIVGNMGSHSRFDYTALGDTVNLGSRLEGQSKPYGILIVIGSNTAELVRKRLAVIEIDLIRVKGKTEPEHIFGLVGDEGMLATPKFTDLARHNADMLRAYRKQDWDTATASLELIRECDDVLGLNLDDYTFIYETRIAEFSSNPPGQAWDGVYSATSK
ncbi:CHASE2 domain-containing protein [Ahrensia sp. R2A130]|uniref:CHASE2 domain-containing protein n=1 Tax=Ahrensia sp. R2A130 TaxID=744979 RepID=UPI0001E09BF2|nr:adenylate/guanylate cyclase domain-containing protein [Ahrensia sp. R2A130]EFL90017.1 adenylate/guanylyl cyclase [Ahrensia sp. R2A130]